MTGTPRYTELNRKCVHVKLYDNSTTEDKGHVEEEKFRDVENEVVILQE